MPQYVVLLELSVSPKRGFRHDFEVSAKWAPESLPVEGLHWAWVTVINVLLRCFSCMSHIVKGLLLTTSNVPFRIYTTHNAIEDF